MIYAEGDEVDKLRSSCSEEALNSLVCTARSIHVGTGVQKLVMRGIVGDTKFVWNVMGTSFTNEWARLIGSNPFRREQYCFVDAEGNRLASVGTCCLYN